MEDTSKGDKKLLNQHEVMTDIREKINQKEILQKQLNDLEWDCDILMNLAKCSSKEDIESLLEEFLPQVQPQPVETSSPNYSITDRLMSYKYLGISATKKDDGDIFLEYLPFSGHKPPLISMVLFSVDNDGKYKLKDFNLPHKIPVDNLTEKYLGDEENNITAFVCALHRYVYAFWVREAHVHRIKTFSFMEKYQVYHNRSKTVITFRLDLIGEVKVEVCLQFRHGTVLPFDVSFVEIANKLLSERHNRALDELKQSLLEHPFPEVLRSNFEDLEADGVTDTPQQRTDASSSDDSRNTVVFELGGSHEQ